MGTTSTVVTTRRAGRSAEVVEVDGQRTIPSTVFVDDDGTLRVGMAALQLAAGRPDRAVRAPKRRLDDDGPIVVGGRALTSVELVAALIDHGAREAIRRHGSGPTEVWLTHPAAWSDLARNRLVQAAARAGLPEPRLLPEPIAAAHSLVDPPPPGGRVAIYDLGGDTFDTVALRVVDGGFEQISEALGSRTVGGELLDEMIMAHVGERIPEYLFDAIIGSDDSAWVRANVDLRSACRAAKEAVSAHPYAEVVVSTPHGLISERIARAEIEQLAAPLVDETMTLLSRVIDAAGGVDVVHLVGGGSRMPVVASMIRERWPDVTVGLTGDPRVAVALGAAAQSVSEPAAAAPERQDGAVSPLAAPAFTVLDDAPQRFGNVASPTAEVVEPQRSAEEKKSGGRRVALLATVAFVWLGAAAGLVMWMIDRDTNGVDGGETAISADASGGDEEAADSDASDGATTTQPTPEEADGLQTELADDEDDSVDNEEPADTTAPISGDDQRRYVIGETLDGGDYVVTTTGTGSCPVGELAVRPNGATEPGELIIIVGVESEIVEGPQGSLLLIERCDGQLVSVRSGSQLSGSLDQRTLELLALVPSPSRLENVAFDFVDQRIVGDALFEAQGSWTEVEISLADGSVTELGPSPSRPRLDVSAAGLYVTDSLTGEIEPIPFGTLRPFVDEQLGALTPSPEPVAVPASCADTFDELLSYGAVSVGYRDNQLVGWYLDPVGRNQATTVSDVGLGTHLLDLRLVDPTIAPVDENGRLIARFADTPDDADFGVYVAEFSGDSNNDVIVAMRGGAACDELVFG